MKKQILKKILFLVYIQTLSNFYFTFGTKIPKSCQNCFLRVQTNILIKKFFSILHFFLLWSEYFLTFDGFDSFLCKLVKNAFDAFRLHFEETDISQCFLFPMYIRMLNKQFSDFRVLESVFLHKAQNWQKQ